MHVSGDNLNCGACLRTWSSLHVGFTKAANDRKKKFDDDGELQPEIDNELNCNQSDNELV